MKKKKKFDCLVLFGQYLIMYSVFILNLEDVYKRFLGIK